MKTMDKNVKFYQINDNGPFNAVKLQIKWSQVRSQPGSHTFVEIDRELIFLVILLLLIQEGLVNPLVKLSQEKVW